MWRFPLIRVHAALRRNGATKVSGPGLKDFLVSEPVGGGRGTQEVDDTPYLLKEDFAAKGRKGHLPHLVI